MNTLLVFKLCLVLLLLFIVANLARALLIMIKGNERAPMSHYLGRRVMFSALLIFLLLIALASGLIHLNPAPI